MKYLAADFGSTYTKLTAIDAAAGRVLATANAFTTIDTDVMRGFDKALESLKAKVRDFEYDELLCCSSAGGGLKMVALGLVPELTSKAARMAAANAGAKVVKTYAYEISAEEQREIYEINPDIVLLCGGTDGGNKDTVIANAGLLGEIKRGFAVIYAGNKSAARDVEAILCDAGKNFVITKNVMPVFNQLDIEPAQNAIRELFIKNIVAAKGLSNAQAKSAREIIPTPLAVLRACELLALGTPKTSGMGDFIAVDLGGATTDVYSLSKGEASLDNVLVKGLPEPYCKRTVEGDLGMRYSLAHVAEQTDIDRMAAQINVSAREIKDWVARCSQTPDIISAAGSKERAIDEAFARRAIELALTRHCGVLEKAYTPLGEIFTLTGKDLSRAQYLIGIGGIIINSALPQYMLEGGCHTPQNRAFMLPREPLYMQDKKYIFSAMGLLSEVDPELALNIMKQEIRQL
ncbi:MAG: glutamate mutase L [Elusimicrobiota bacterium]|jgi:uncharacterized protein (TIGR01319 family)|nr:glutamate mutase L [Elusimicrobiota bacterium]